jgi:hypothetical protein
MVIATNSAMAISAAKLHPTISDNHLRFTQSERQRDWKKHEWRQAKFANTPI